MCVRACLCVRMCVHMHACACACLSRFAFFFGGDTGYCPIFAKVLSVRVYMSVCDRARAPATLRVCVVVSVGVCVGASVCKGAVCLCV